MSIEVDWACDSRSAILIRCQARWDRNAWVEAEARIDALLNRQTMRVGAVLDARGIDLPASALGEFGMVFEGESSLNPRRISPIVVVSQSQRLDMVISIMREVHQLGEDQIRLTRSLDEALRYVQSLRPSERL